MRKIMNLNYSQTKEKLLREKNKYQRLIEQYQKVRLCKIRIPKVKEEEKTEKHVDKYIS